MFREVIIAVTSTVVGVLLTLLPKWIKQGISTPNLVRKLTRGMEALIRVNQAQNEALSLTVSAMRAVLEAIVTNRVNGGITNAGKDNEKAAALMEDAGKEINAFLIAETAGARK